MSPSPIVRRVAMACAAVIVVAWWWTAGTPAAGASTLSDARAELASARAQLGRLQTELDEVTRDYMNAEGRLYEIDDAVARAEKDIERSERDLLLMRDKVTRRLVDLYKSNHASTPAFLVILFEERDFSSVVQRVDQLNRVAELDDDTLDDVRRHLDKVNALRADLEVKRGEQAEQVAELQRARAAMESRLQATTTEYRRLKKRVAVLAEAERRAREAARARAQAAVSGSAGSSAAARGFVFPVDGPHSFINDWGFARSGGRSHKGTDIFASRGTPVVAVVNGRIRRTAYGSGLGGTIIWLSGDNGTSYYYAHLDGIAGGIGAGTRVVAGQTIGYVGSTGNARGGSPHLHFEIHPGGGGAVNPYNILRASD